jgi:hypothetical protein
MTHDDLRNLVPLLALDALPENEEAEVVAHLNSCRECSELLAGHRETAAALALAPPPVMPSDLLRERILREAAVTGQPSLRQAAEAPRMRAPRRGFRLAASLAAAAVLIAGGLAGMQIGRQNAELREQRRLIAEQRRALDLAAADSAAIVPISFTGDFSSFEGKLVVAEDEGRAAVLLSRMSEPGDRVYTLWLLPEAGQPENLADFRPVDGRAFVNVEVEAGAQDDFAVTLEPRAGNASPAGPVVGSADRPSEEQSVSA